MIKAHIHRSISLALLVIATSVQAEWVLDNSASAIHFVSTKKSQIAETHSFKEFRGGINDFGVLNIQITLDSVETLIPIRNDRMRELLFETDRFPLAAVTATVDVETLDQLSVGETIAQPLDVVLSLHGEKATVNAKLKAVKLTGEKLWVSTTEPVIVNLADFDLLNGLKQLQEIAGLPSISSAAPSTVDLVFRKK